ncbi:MAG: hypothetical protein GEV06_09605 [Luteitalea sp.]|nr:hypothetical protein [Luteitalea sp.]
MARSRPTQLKRERERARMDRQRQKAARRQATKVRRSEAPAREGDEDPDIAGIRPGPQPLPWADEEME